MTVESQITKISADCNGSALQFSFSPLVLLSASSELQVTLVSSDGTEEILAEGEAAANYKVHVSAYPGTGYIDYPADLSTPAPSGQRLVMKRMITIAQPVNLENQGGYFPEVQEQAFDRGIMIALQQQEELDRSLKVSIADESGADFTIPPPEAGKAIKWNDAADGLKNSDYDIDAAAATAISAAGTAEDARDAAQTAQAGAEAAKAAAEDARDEALAADFNSAFEVVAKSSGYTAVAVDRSKLIRCTSTLTLALTAAATLGNGWLITVQADGGDVTVDPSGAETINGSATLTVADGETAIVWCDGIGFYANPPPETVRSLGGLALSAGDILYATGGNALGRLAAGSDDQVLTLASGIPAWADPASSVLPKLHVRDEKTSTTDGGSTSSSSTVTRDINTVLTNTILGASLSSNQITLTVDGTYDILAIVPGYGSSRHRAFLYDVTNSVILILGTSEYTNNANGFVTSKSFITGQFTVSGTTVLEVRHYFQAGNSTGLGLASEDGNTEVYTDVQIRRLG